MAIEERENDWFKFYYATYYKKSPYHRRAVEAGCTSWDLYNHMLIPTLYDDDVEEYWHLVNHVTLWDVAVERQLEIKGPDAARFTQLLTPRDLSATVPEQCKYVLICAPDGGIVNDPILLKLAEDHFWLSLADSDALLYAKGVQAFANMDVELGEPDVSPLQIQGPRSKPLVRALFGDEVADQRYYWHKQTELDGIPVVVSRTGWTAELGYEVYLRDSSRALELWDAIIAAGESVRPPGDGAERPAAPRGGDLQLRQRHGRHEQPVRDHGARAARRARQRQRGGVTGRPGADPTRGRHQQARRGHDRRARRSGCGWRISGRCASRAQRSGV